MKLQQDALRTVALVAIIYGIGSAIVLVIAGIAFLTHTGEGLPEFIKSLHHISEAYHPGFLHHILVTLSGISWSYLLLLIFCYSLSHFVEGYGLWKKRKWGELYCTFDSLIYVPFELESMYHKITWVNTSSLIINLMLVGYMMYLLLSKKAKS